MPTLYVLYSFFNLPAESVLCSWQSYSNFGPHIALYKGFPIFSIFFPTTTFIVFNALALNMLICSSQFNLPCNVIPKKRILSLVGIILFLLLVTPCNALDATLRLLVLQRAIHPLHFPVLLINN